MLHYRVDDAICLEQGKIALFLWLHQGEDSPQYELSDALNMDLLLTTLPGRMNAAQWKKGENPEVGGREIRRNGLVLEYAHMPG